MRLNAFAPSTAWRALRSLFDRRAQRRWAAYWPTVIVAPEGAVPLHLVDVSTRGARGYAVSPPRMGTVCDLLLHDQQMRAEIMWVNYRSFGLKFVQPIPDQLVERLSIRG